MTKKVVITGMGIVSPLGNDIDTYWKNIVEGHSGVGLIKRFDVSAYKSRIAAECEQVVPEGMTEKDTNRIDRYAVYAIEACDQAWKQAGLDIESEDADRCGAIIGSGIGGIETIANEVVKLDKGGPRRVSPFMIPKGISNMASGNVGIRLGLRGPNKAVVTACAASNHSIGEAAMQIMHGRADVMVAGGAEAAIVPFGMSGFMQMKALSTRNEDPQHASRPFDKDRDGFVMGEGAGCLVLESEEHAKARGAEILAQYLGMGESCDAYHITSPRPDGSGAASAMNHALNDAKINREDVDYFNAHGTSTVPNELGEAKALHAVFGEDMPLVSSTKSMTGHLLGAAGAIEAVASIFAIRDGVVPPNINIDNLDPECAVNLVANEAREAEVAIIMSNSLGFGGHNATLVLKRYE